MSTIYSPDDNAYADALKSIKVLSQRDVALHIPINFVPVAGVRLASACFPRLRYETSSAVKCISNLLAAGFRRFVLDIYWDESRNIWSFCPAQIESTSNAGSPTSAASLSTQAQAATQLPREALLEFVARQLSVTSSTVPQASSTVPAPSTTVTQTEGATAATAASSAATPAPSGGSIVQIGQYACSPDLTLSTFFSVLVAHLQVTENNLNATTNYLELNLHAAAANPAAPASTPRVLPNSNATLSSIINTNASTYLFTPASLQQQRANLNATGSWYNVPQDVLPDSSYFTVNTQNGISSTPNGWPSESFVEFTRYRRLLVSFAEIQPEMRGYNRSLDADNIFQPGYITQLSSPSLSSGGRVQNGCFYNSAITSLEALNNSWAVASVQTSQPLLTQTSSLIDCGYTPLLNQTIDNFTAAENISVYADFVLQSIWSWDTREPRDNSGQCAALNSTTGRWQVDACSSAHHCACDTGTPYQWRISGERLSYDRTDQSCPSGSRFGVSRTALENSHLVNAWRQARSSNSISDELLWVNLNDLSIPGCWVEGQNTTCPYQEQDDNESRTVYVPVVAGVIVLVLTILTIIVKCSANRRTSRRQRRRGDNGWEYEGVPS